MRQRDERKMWGLLHLDLAGVDDVDVISSIRWKCLYSSNTLGSVGLVLLATSACLGVLAGILSELLPAARYAVWMIIPGGVGVPIVSWYWRRAALRVLPEVLRSMGRCLRCGYRLCPSNGGRCPECGTAGQKTRQDNPLGGKSEPDTRSETGGK